MPTPAELGKELLDLFDHGAGGHDKDSTISKVKELLNKGADPSVRDERERTPLMLAGFAQRCEHMPASPRPWR